MSTKPLVGIVGHGFLVPRFFGELPVSGVSQAYVDAIQQAGGRPLVLPAASALELLDAVDALVLTGGGDIDPGRFGGSGPARDVDPDRDRTELAVARAAADLRVPLLAVCRGMQVLAVAGRGTLDQIGETHELPGTGHDVAMVPGSRAHSLLGASTRTTALHRWAVADPGPDWTVTARSEDGTTEAIEPARSGWAAVGIQWHPELPQLGDRTGPALFGWLVEAAQAWSGRSRSVGQSSGMS